MKKDHLIEDDFVIDSINYPDDKEEISFNKLEDATNRFNSLENNLASKYASEHWEAIKKSLSDIFEELKKMESDRQKKHIASLEQVYKVLKMLDSRRVLENKWSIDKIKHEVDKIQYHSTRSQRVLNVFKKIIFGVLAGIFGFAIGLLIGTVFSGGVPNIPSAILVSFKSVAAFWGSTSAHFGLGSVICIAFGAPPLYKTLTSSSIEKALVTIKNHTILLSANLNITRLKEKLKNQKNDEIQKYLEGAIIRAEDLGKRAQKKLCIYEKNSLRSKSANILECVRQIVESPEEYKEEKIIKLKGVLNSHRHKLFDTIVGKKKTKSSIFMEDFYEKNKPVIRASQPCY